MNRKDEHLDYGKVRIVTFLGFLFGLSMATLVYVVSSYYKEALGSENVGIFYVVSFSVLLLALLHFHKIISRFGRARTLLFMLLLQIVLMFTLSFLPVSLFGASLIVMYYIAYGIIWALWDVVLEAYSADNASGRIRGMFLSVWGIGVLIGPMLATTLLENYGFTALFVVVLILYILMFLVVLTMLNSIRGHVSAQDSAAHTLARAWKTVNIRNIYWIGCTLRFFFATMTIFMPLYLRSLEFSWVEIGWIFTVMLLPFILFEYPAGVLADKKYGEKEILFIGLLLIIVAVVLIVLTKSTEIWVWMAILFLSRTGAALVDSMHDAYFYKQIAAKDIALINFFRSTRSIGYISAALLSSIILLFGSIETVFGVLLIVLACGFYPIIILHDTVPEKDR